MTPNVSVEAKRELINGAVFYAREANADLSLAFIAEFERALRILCRRPNLGPVWRGSARRFPLRRFPYSIIYLVGSDELRVIALAHQKRRPDYWRGRK